MRNAFEQRHPVIGHRLVRYLGTTTAFLGFATGSAHYESWSIARQAQGTTNADSASGDASALSNAQAEIASANDYENMVEPLAISVGALAVVTAVGAIGVAVARRRDHELGIQPAAPMVGGIEN